MRTVLAVLLSLSVLGAVAASLEEDVQKYVGIFSGDKNGHVSAAQSLSARGTRARIPEQLQQGVITAVRPLFGAAAAAAAFVLFAPTIDKVAGLLGVAFAAGFSERVITRAVASGPWAQRPGAPE